MIVKIRVPGHLEGRDWCRAFCGYMNDRSRPTVAAHFARSRLILTSAIEQSGRW